MIYWLASYPKSGNTWMRILLSNYLLDADKPVNINNLAGGPIASARSVFDEFIGIPASDLTQDEIENWRPLVYQQMALEAQAPIFLKIHDAFVQTSNHLELIPAEATTGVLYLIRNPLDVCVSFAHHSSVTVEKTIERMADSSYTFCSNEHRLPNQLRQKLLSWSEHVTSWVDQSGLRILIVRYEDLLADTHATFEKVVRFCRLDAAPERISKAVEFSHFEQLSQQEKEFGFSEKAFNSESFFRQGRSGTWTQQLTPEQSHRLIAAHTDVMRRFGYLNDREQVIFTEPTQEQKA